MSPDVDQQPRLSIAYWSPLNPCKSGISDYSEQLLLHLARHADIDVYVDGYVPANKLITERFAVFDDHVIADNTYDVNLYQMGNSLLHEYIYARLCAYPGVVVLHDYYLHGFVYNITATRGHRERYLDELEYSDGSQARVTAERNLADGKVDIFTHPLNRRVVESSLGIIVHSQWIASLLRKRGVQQPIAVIPLGSKVLPVSGRRRAALRSCLGLAPDTLVIGCWGHITPIKRIGTVIRAFSRLRTLFPRSELVLVGQPDFGMALQLKDWILRHQLEDCVRVTGYVRAQAFKGYLQVSDICVNLRYPSAGETSATLCQALGAGLPVLASNIPQFAEFPDDCVWKVDTGASEEDQLLAFLLELAFDADLRRRMGQKAQDYVAVHATWPKVAVQYARFLEQITA